MDGRVSVLRGGGGDYSVPRARTGELQAGGARGRGQVVIPSPFVLCVWSRCVSCFATEEEPPDLLTYASPPPSPMLTNAPPLPTKVSNK